MNLIPSRCWACNAATSEIVGTKSQVERRRDSFPGIRSLPCPPTFIFGRIVSLDDYFILYIYIFFFWMEQKIPIRTNRSEWIRSYPILCWGRMGNGARTQNRENLEKTHDPSLSPQMGPEDARMRPKKETTGSTPSILIFLQDGGTGVVGGPPNIHCLTQFDDAERITPPVRCRVRHWSVGLSRSSIPRGNECVQQQAGESLSCSHPP